MAGWEVWWTPVLKSFSHAQRKLVNKVCEFISGKGPLFEDDRADRDVGEPAHGETQLILS